MVQQKYDYIQLCDELPELDPESFEEVCHNLLFHQQRINFSCLENFIKLMQDHRRGQGQYMVARLCELVLRLCQDNDIEINAPYTKDEIEKRAKEAAGKAGKSKNL